MGMHEPADCDRSLPMREAPSPHWHGYFHALSRPAHRSSVVVSAHYHPPVAMDPGVPFPGGREGTIGKVWRGIRGISSASTHVLSQSTLRFQNSVCSHRDDKRRSGLLDGIREKDTWIGKVCQVERRGWYSIEINVILIVINAGIAFTSSNLVEVVAQ